MNTSIKKMIQGTCTFCLGVRKVEEQHGFSETLRVKLRPGGEPVIPLVGRLRLETCELQE